MVTDADLGSLGRERVEEALLSEAVFPVEPVSIVSKSSTDEGLAGCSHLSRSSYIYQVPESAMNLRIQDPELRTLICSSETIQVGILDSTARRHVVREARVARSCPGSVGLCSDLCKRRCIRPRRTRGSLKYRESSVWSGGRGKGGTHDVHGSRVVGWDVAVLVGDYSSEGRRDESEGSDEHCSRGDHRGGLIESIHAVEAEEDEEGEKPGEAAVRLSPLVTDAFDPNTCARLRG